jgi:hypothetical protein
LSYAGDGTVTLPQRSRLVIMDSTNSPAQRNLTQLTVEEKRAREKAVDFYRYVGKTEAEARRLAWADVRKEFPHLQECDMPPDIE